eukprot:COSAG06_NODE_7015_length_2672_cov_11.344988_3_plen_85_part_00
MIAWPKTKEEMEASQFDAELQVAMGESADVWVNGFSCVSHMGDELSDMVNAVGLAIFGQRALRKPRGGSKRRGKAKDKPSRLYG